MSEPKLSTITITEDDTPTFSILRGHHLTEIFNQAFENEGWKELPLWEDEDVTHEYWVEEGPNSWKCSNKYDPKAVPVTVAAWYPVSEIEAQTKKVH